MQLFPNHSEAAVSSIPLHIWIFSPEREAQRGRTGLLCHMCRVVFHESPTDLSSNVHGTQGDIKREAVKDFTSSVTYLNTKAGAEHNVQLELHCSICFYVPPQHTHTRFSIVMSTLIDKMHDLKF